MDSEHKKKIAAGIVLFNSDDSIRLLACINSVLSQVEKVYIFDNSTINTDVGLSDNIVYVTEHDNKGIAYALNHIMQMAKDDGYEWVITMDQDSILPEGMLIDFEKRIVDNEDIAIICPQVIDKRRVYMQINEENTEEFIDMCITSASCTSISAWEKIGKFDEWLFIDLVDNEFCKRLIVSGYKILQLNKWVLDQEFGKIVPKSERVQRFWIAISKIFRNKNFAKFSYKKIVSPLRVYYTNRNIVYVNKKLKVYGPVAYENYNCKGYIGFLVSFSLPSFLRAEEKGKVLQAILKGIKDGRSKEVEPWMAKGKR